MCWSGSSTYENLVPLLTREQVTCEKSRVVTLSLPRAILGRLLAAQTGHGNFAQYHEHFGHDNAKLECSCESLKTPHHFYCWKGCKAFSHPWGWRQMDGILHSKSGTRDFHEWLQRSHFYCTICPAHWNAPPKFSSFISPSSSSFPLPTQNMHCCSGGQKL